MRIDGKEREVEETGREKERESNRIGIHETRTTHHGSPSVMETENVKE